MGARRTRTPQLTARGLWLRWVGSTALGVVLAFAAFLAIFLIIGDPGDVLFPILIVGFGLVIGAFQQRGLRRSLGDAKRWALATGLGFGGGMALVVATGLGEAPGLAAQITQGAVAGALVGAVIGSAQWLVIRARVPGARWWVIASIAGWAVGAAVGDAVGYFADGLDLVVAPVVAASVTGIALVALLRPQPGAVPETAAASMPAPATDVS
jgi:hypothetical protein